MRAPEEPLWRLEKMLPLTPEERKTDAEDKRELVMETHASEKAVGTGM